MRYCIDALEYNGKSFYVRGWAAPERQGDPVQLKAVDSKGNEVPLSPEKVLRSDVLMAMYGKDGQEKYGFSFVYESDNYEDTVLDVQNTALSFDHITIHLRFREEKERFDREHTMFGTMKRYLRSDNKKDFFMNERFSMITGENHDYAVWYEKHLPSRETLKKEQAEVFAHMPLVSILVPVYKPVKRQFEEMIRSVRRQSYRNFELVLANGSPEDSEIAEVIRKAMAKESRIRLAGLKENGGISVNTNAALASASGEWIALLDQDDMLTEDALYEMVKALNAHPDTELLYSDEDKLEDETGFHRDPYFKPDYSPALLHTNNYFCHFLMLKKALAEKAGAFRKEYDGAQDFDFVLRCTEQTAGPVIHVPHILYNWRIHAQSTAGNIAEKGGAQDAGRRALAEAYRRRGTPAEVSDTKLPGRYRVTYERAEKPLVSILIPTKDHSADLNRCVNSLIGKSTYTNFEIILIENNSTEKETFENYEALQQKDGRIRVVTWEKEFNYSAINNFGAKYAKGEWLLLLNNDTEVITPDFLVSMLQYADEEGTAVVGARLLYPDNTIQHAGVVALTEGAAHHIYLNASKDEVGYMGRLVLPCNVSAVTGACMLVKKSVYDALGGLSEDFAVAYNDVDFCLRVLDEGLRIVYDPYAELYHFESKSRGYDDQTKEKKARQKKEADLLYARHPERIGCDPYYNPNFDLKKGYYKLP